MDCPPPALSRPSSSYERSRRPTAPLLSIACVASPSDLASTSMTRANVRCSALGKPTTTLATHEEAMGDVGSEAG